jgi:uncharacterized protein with FMN-binding domain
MKRALLIVGGTVGGLGAVLAITPPQFTSSQGINVAGGGIGNPSGNSAASAAPASTPATTASQSASATPTAQQSVAATKTAKAKAKAVATKKAAAKSATNNSSGSVTSAASQTPSSAPATQSATPAPVKTTPAPAKATSSGTFDGPVVNVSYGYVQVQITVSNGKITDATALQAPTGRSDRFSSYAVPILRQQTLAAQSDQITGASGASYTSYGWYKSLQGALAKAGL